MLDVVQGVATTAGRNSIREIALISTELALLEATYCSLIQTAGHLVPGPRRHLVLDAADLLRRQLRPGPLGAVEL